MLNFQLDLNIAPYSFRLFEIHRFNKFNLSFESKMLNFNSFIKIIFFLKRKIFYTFFN